MLHSCIQPHDNMDVQVFRVGKLIGPRGAYIQQLEQETGASIRVPSERHVPFSVSIRADNATSLAVAMEAVSHILEGRE